MRDVIHYLIQISTTLFLNFARKNMFDLKTKISSIAKRVCTKTERKIHNFMISIYIKCPYTVIRFIVNNLKDPRYIACRYFENNLI